MVVNAIHDGHGLLLGYAKVTRDLTERKRLEETLLSSEAALGAERERLQVTLDSIADGVVCTDEAGNITLMNPAAGEYDWMDSGPGLWPTPLEEVLNHVIDLAEVGPRSGIPVRHCLIRQKDFPPSTAWGGPLSHTGTAPDAISRILRRPCERRTERL